jgi:hypothetical protein
MSATEVNTGLTAPFAAVALLGSGGATAVLILVFMAVTSAASAELTAVSSIITYDVYRTYFNERATSRDIIKASHWSIGIFGLLMGVLAVILNAIGISLGYLYELMGTLVSCAVIPIALTITWKKQTAFGAICGTILGCVAGIASWLIVAKVQYGEITLDSTFGDYPMLTGNLTSLLFSGLVTIVISLIKPDNFDWKVLNSLEKVLDEADEEMKLDLDDSETDPVRLNKAARFAVWSSVILTILLLIIWPIPMFLSKYEFSSSFFSGWIIFGLVWTIIAAITVTFYPLVESRDAIFGILKGFANELSGHKPVSRKGSSATIVEVQKE